MTIDEAIKKLRSLLKDLEKDVITGYHSKFNIWGENMIHVWNKLSGEDILRVTDEDMLDCHIRAINELEGYLKKRGN